MKKITDKLSDLFYTVKVKVNNFYWHRVRCIFIPQQKWLTSSIPKTWCDKPELISDVLFTILINFVEEEKGLENIATQVIYARNDEDGHYGEHAIKRHDAYLEVCKDLTNAYNWAKKRHEIEENIYAPVKGVNLGDVVNVSNVFSDPDIAKKFENVNNLQEAYKEQEDIHLLSILKHKDYMWT